MRGTAEIRAMGSGTSMARAFCALAAAAAMPFAAAALSAQLRTLGLERRGGPGWRRYCTSGEPETFSRLAAGFLGHTITAERQVPQDG